VVGDAVNTAQGSCVAQGAMINFGTTAERYQWITTATDFDTAGFPYYLSLLGTDDSLTSTTGGGGSAGFFWCGAIKPTGGAGTVFVGRPAINGYIMRITASCTHFLPGTVWRSFKLSTATVDVGTTYLLTVWDDGTNLNVQINSAAAETVARPVVVAGTAGFTRFKSKPVATNFIGYDTPQSTENTAQQQSAR
jgi:hypothetical protein